MKKLRKGMVLFLSLCMITLFIPITAHAITIDITGTINGPTYNGMDVTIRSETGKIIYGKFIDNTVYSKEGALILGGDFINSQIVDDGNGRYGLKMDTENLAIDQPLSEYTIYGESTPKDYAIMRYNHDFSFKLLTDTANGYYPPASISIMKGQTELSSQSDYTYDMNTGTVTINGSCVTAPMTLKASGVIAPHLSVMTPVFAEEQEGYHQPAAQSVTIANQGAADAAISDITLIGANMDSFTLIGPQTGSIPAGAADHTLWAIQPKENLECGTYIAALNVTYDDGRIASADVSFTVSHSHQYNGWSSDAAHHWKECIAGDNVIDKAAHTFGGWVIDTNPSESEKGSRHRVCSVCNYEEKEEIPVVTHTHTPETTWNSDKDNHWHECVAHDGEKIGKDSHTAGSWIIDKSATETEAGSRHQECTVCHYVMKIQIIVPTGLPEAYTLIVGQNVSWKPAPSGGEWSYDKDFLEMTQDGGTYTFKALKVGKVTATYTVESVSCTVTITINKAGEVPSPAPQNPAPQTGDTSKYAAILAAGLVLTAGLHRSDFPQEAES
ncbi:hypothetical protein [Qiania dongpingensis]|uniref:Uncharacterized protein n=1 Tax=Qiania dongpingensis TaxID=2763669 RepID=A0A7G9G2W1_9FIRM|nr:hypothetical protein [Qiania dongpingensis]QNM05143.1 hypothetical protein H9Q78_11935 [Qiania dongpingensis]